jgi:hypothetical protein
MTLYGSCLEFLGRSVGITEGVVEQRVNIMINWNTSVEPAFIGTLNSVSVVRKAPGLNIALVLECVPTLILAKARSFFISPRRVRWGWRRVRGVVVGC